MRKLIGRSIRHKVIAAILLTSCVSLLVAFAVLIIYEWRTADSGLVERLSTSGRIVRENVAAAVAFQVPKEAEKTVAALQNDNEVVAAGVYDEDGNRMAGFEKQGFAYRLPESAPPDGLTKRTDEVVIAMPIEMNGDRLGTLLLAANYEERNERFILYLGTAGMMFLLAVGISVFLSSVLEERISKPILSLVNSTRRVTAERNYDVEVRVSETTEVGRLATAFNQMLREVNRREALLTQAMDRLRLTLEASKTFTWEWSRNDGRFTWQSTEGMPETLAALNNNSPKDILQKIDPESQDNILHSLRSISASEGEFEFDFLLLSNGNPLEVACRGKVFRDETGEIERALGVATDVTERRKTERDLYWREQEFRALVEHSPDMIARYNRELRVEYVSPIAATYTGIPIEKMQGHTLEEMGVPEERINVWRIAIERIYNGASQTEIEFEFPHPDGSLRYFIARLVPEYAPSGEVVHVLAVSRDITERRQYEEALRSAKEKAEEGARAKSVFLSNMSHDIRTPLTTILGCAELLKDRGDEEMREIVDLIRSGGKRLMDTLNSVLDLARMESGETELNFEPVLINRELEELIQMFRMRAEEKQLELSYRPCDEPVTGQVDRAAFTRIMMNIIGNAVKFTSEGSVTVRLWKEKRRFFISVEDTGPGIPKQTRETIFDAFTRSRQSEVRQIEGSGLGMTITRQLVKLLNGAILVESEVGKGSVFTVTLNCSDERSSPKPLESSSPPDSQTERISGSLNTSLLIVEDNANTVRLLELLLDGKYDYTVCFTGPEALDKARNRIFDVVLMDLGLETSEAGVGYMRKLRAINGYQQVPIVAFTAHALPGEEERLMRLGFDDYLGKPFTGESLGEVLNRCLHSRHQR